MDARRQDGQALPLALGGAFALIVAVQRTADLVAISAARSMRDDLAGLLAPSRLPDGSANPRHIEKAAYLARARVAATAAAKANGVPAARLRVSFPDADSFAPVRTEAVITAAIEVGGGTARTEASAVAEAGAPSSSSAESSTAMASGGGYSGPLVDRQGHGMRPDVAAAFDRMAAAAGQAGLALIVNSGFRSDAEQAALFAAHPDPTWVAPPGHSLHRCATELDLGPEAAYGWLAANAGRFGFVQRYSWESALFIEGATTGRTGTSGRTSAP
jgi:hypothetical protein